MLIPLRTFALLLIVLGGSSGERVEEIHGTSGSRTDALEVHSGGVVVREGEPGSAFGTVRIGTGKRQLSYFVVFKHRIDTADKTSFDAVTNARDLEGASQQTLSIDAREVKLEYKVKLDPGTKKLSSETLTITGKNIDLARGRVLLVDLTTSPPTWEQRALNLPAEINDTTSKKGAQALAKKVLASLAKQDRKAKAFIEAAGK
jgi:hypothetical protein